LEVVGRKFSHRPGNPAAVGVVRWPAAGDTAGSSLRLLSSLQHRIYNLLGSYPVPVLISTAKDFCGGTFSVIASSAFTASSRMKMFVSAVFDSRVTTV